MKAHPICPVCDNPLDCFETSRYGTLLHTTQRYLERCRFALDIWRVGRDEALTKWAAMGGEAAVMARWIWRFRVVSVRRIKTRYRLHGDGPASIIAVARKNLVKTDMRTTSY